jgi:hypothetical protein
MTKADVQRLWAQGRPGQVVFLTDLRMRGLAFEPEEDWLAGLPTATKVPTTTVPEMFTSLQKLVPPAPEVDAVAREAPALLGQIKTVAQARQDLAGLVHPELLVDKVKVYDLFDTANYRNHQLGKFSPAASRRVGVQFFQLTTNEVERLHYVHFATSRGKLVVRDIVTGAEVASLFLKDEQQLAMTKLELVFRALNDGDDAALKTLCTPGLLEDLKGLGQTAAFPLRGLPPYSQIKATSSVPLDQKAIRVVVRVEYTLRGSERIDFDLDFERVDNDLRVVRLRDVDNTVIAVDPEIENHLRKRFGLPPGAPLSQVTRTSKTIFLSFDRMIQLARNGIDDRQAAEVKKWGTMAINVRPDDGAGYGMLASAHHLAGSYTEADTAVLDAIKRGGTVFFRVQRHQIFNRQGRQLFDVILGVSRDRIQYMPIRGGSSEGVGVEEFPATGIEKVEIERGNLLAKPRPFLSLEFRPDLSKRDKRDYNFASFGTTCPEIAQPEAVRELVPYVGGSVCANVPTAGGQAPAPMLVPRDWERNLRVVIRALEEAKRAAIPSKGAR